MYDIWLNKTNQYLFFLNILPSVVQQTKYILKAMKTKTVNIM